MNETLSPTAGVLLGGSLGLLAANEVRGLVLAGPVLYAIFQAGGTLMAIWIGICSLAGIILSVLGPIFIANKLGLRCRLRLFAAPAHIPPCHQ